MKRQDMLKMLVEDRTRFIIGGYENEILDEYIGEMPTAEILALVIYDEVMETEKIFTDDGIVVITSEFRFEGKKKIMETIRESVERVLNE